MKIGRFSRDIITQVVLTLLLLFSESSIAQVVIKGTVLYKKDGAPAASASVELANDIHSKTMCDNEGNFHLNITKVQTRDTLIISSIGYQTFKLPVSVALTRSIFILPEMAKTIDNVTIFNTHQTVGSNSENVGYYRGWDYKHSGGEIGRIFNLPYKKFKIDRIRFKAGNTCDTCLLRLHIRSLENGFPGDEIFKDSISVYVNNLSLDSKISEFDLTGYDYIFTENDIYFGIEVLNCGNGKKGFCSFNFAGTEKGEYLFKSTTNSPWQSTDDYTIYLKLFLRF
jgi:hypothetical protein